MEEQRVENYQTFMGMMHISCVNLEDPVVSDITRITCECGTPLLTRYYDEHLKSNKHARLMAKTYKLGLLEHTPQPRRAIKLNHYMLKHILSSNLLIHY